MLQKNINLENQENIAHAASHKNKIVELLHKEIQAYSTLRVDYEKLRDVKASFLEKFNLIESQIKISNQRNSDGRDYKATNESEVRSNILKLENELRAKRNTLKELQAQNNSLQASIQSKEYEHLSRSEDSETLKNEGIKLKAEQTKIQEKIKNADKCLKSYEQKHKQVNKSIHSIRYNILEVEQFLRHLNMEGSNLENQAQASRQRNNEANQINANLDSCTQLCREKIREAAQQVQKNKFERKSQLLQRGRIQRQIEQKKKLLKQELQKQKSLKDQMNKKKRELGHLKGLMADVEESKEKLTYEILEIMEVNDKMKEDLKQCQAHQTNLHQNNTYLSKELEKYEQRNQEVISKLKKLCSHDKQNGVKKQKKGLENPESSWGLSGNKWRSWDKVEDLGETSEGQYLM